MLRAGNGTRTRDPNLGKVVLYQLSYSRNLRRILLAGFPLGNRGAEAPTADAPKWRRGGSNP